MIDHSAERVVRETGDALRACGFTIDALSQGLTETTAALADLLVEHDPVHKHALPLVVRDLIIKSGLAYLDGDQIIAPRDVRPYSDGVNDWYVVSDAGEPQQNGQEHVLGVGHASLTLASLVPRVQVKNALDLGTGSGVQALHLGTHAESITATDLSTEALQCAALTAALSGQSWDLRQGSLYEPVDRDTFDMIVSNPPFVISHAKHYTYRDAGYEGDSFVRALIEEGSKKLNDDGWLVTLANWLHGERDWRERLIEWLAPTECDAWVVQREVQSADEYVETWIADASDDSVAQQWRSSFSADEEIGFGWIVLHKSGSRSIRLEEIRQGVEHPMGPWVRDRFDSLALTRGDLLSQPLRVPAHHLEGGLISMARGFRRSARLDQLTEEVLSRADGRPIGEVILNLAAERGIGVDTESAIDLVEGLIDLGALRLSTD